MPRSLGKAVKILNSPQQGFAAVQNDREIDEGMSGDVLLDALQQLLQHSSLISFGLS